jgi:hypothetical protein
LEGIVQTADFIALVGPDVARGDVSLWLGPEFDVETESHINRILHTSWLSIWSESQNSTLALSLMRTWSESPELRRRIITEVDRRMHDVLGTYFALSDICPVFYLNGREGSWADLPAREQRRARDEQVDELGRLNGGILLIAGYESSQHILKLISTELPASPIRFVVCGLSAEEQTALRARVSEVDGGTSVLTIFDGTIGDLLDSLNRAVEVGSIGGMTLRVGSRLIDISNALDREHPIDQDFYVLTTDVTRPADSSEKPAELLDNLVAGRTPPWRAFAHNLQWRRGGEIWPGSFNRALELLHTATTFVKCLNVAGEPGSGLSMHLQEVGFKLAQHGYPTLILKPSIRRIDYDLLRVFLEHLSLGVGEVFPAVIIQDDAEAGFDSETNMQEILVRLARDGRHVLAIRGVGVPRGQVLDEYAKKRNALFSRLTDRIEEHWNPSVIRSELGAQEQQSLIAWARRHWGNTPAAFGQVVESWGVDWTGDNEPPPLLVCLYFLLRDNVLSSREFGRHLFSELLSVLVEPRSEKGLGQGESRRLSNPELADAVARLQEHFASGMGHMRNDRTTGPPVSRSDAATVCLSLCIYGALRLLVDRSVLRQQASLTSHQINKLIADLERTDLIRVSFNSYGDSAFRLKARAAYYTDSEAIGLRHPAFGRLLLDWLLQSDENGEAEPLTCKLLSDLRSLVDEPRLPDFPVRLLIPLLSQLQPTDASVEFCESVCVRFLRLQRVRGSDYHAWQWSNRELLLEVLDSLPEAVIRQSSVILHTRGITRYKSCRMSIPLEECRQRYSRAEEDLRLAFARARETSDGERPVNVITSHGLLYQGWARQELERGSQDRANELRGRAREYLREGLRLSNERENTYAAFGLAGLLVEECERQQPGEEVAGAYATNLAEALDLLQLEPNDSFEVEWIELKQRAFALLNNSGLNAVIGKLRAEGDELGLALDALRLVDGVVPAEAGLLTDDQIEAASAVLDVSGFRVRKHSQLAQLLRYALFSVRSVRSSDPAFEERYRLVSVLESSRYLDRPVWLYDYSMLALQLGKYRESAEGFRRLRRGGKFLEVPLERSAMLANPDRPTEALPVTFRVVRRDDDGKGWVRVVTPRGLLEPIPFVARVFDAVGSPTSVGSTFTGRIRIRPGGPIAESSRGT